MKSIIIDNERDEIEGLERILTLFCPEIEVIGEAESLEEGIKLLKNTEPDLVFLDIELGDGSGLDLVKFLPKRYFQVIFITAYNKFAVEAFRLSALDYLLKPINVEELTQAIEKAKEWREKENKLTRLKTLAANILSKNKEDNKIILKAFDGTHVVSVSDIIYCQAEGSYTNFVVAPKKELLVSKNIREYEKTLTNFNFIRTHKSYLVNPIHINKYSTTDKGMILNLKNNQEIPVAVRRREEVLKKLKAL